MSKSLKSLDYINPCAFEESVFDTIGDEWECQDQEFQIGTIFSFSIFAERAKI
jgi:hypothetical protein